MSTERHTEQNTDRKIRVLLIDDHALLREGLSAVLSRYPDLEVIAEVGTAHEALLAYRANRPDVTIIDLRLPDRSGPEIMRELRRDYPEGRFIVLTTYDTPEDAYRSFAAGAAAFLVKDTPAADVVTVVRAVHEGQTFIPAPMRELLDRPKLHIDLTGRERDVLRLLAKGKANREIAAELGISAETVKTYLDRMRAKLNVPDRAALVAQALTRGLIEL
jgi:two-component system NarL family response regulator